MRAAPTGGVARSWLAEKEQIGRDKHLHFTGSVMLMHGSWDWEVCVELLSLASRQSRPNTDPGTNQCFSNQQSRFTIKLNTDKLRRYEIAHDSRTRFVRGRARRAWEAHTSVVASPAPSTQRAQLHATIAPPSDSEASRLDVLHRPTRTQTRIVHSHDETCSPAALTLSHTGATSPRAPINQ